MLVQIDEVTSLGSTTIVLRMTYIRTILLFQLSRKSFLYPDWSLSLRCYLGLCANEASDWNIQGDIGGEVL